MAFSASLKEANFTRAEPVKSEFFLNILRSRISPCSWKNFWRSSSFQLVGRPLTWVIS